MAAVDEGAGEHSVAAAIRAALAESGRSQTWLGVEVASVEGRKSPYSQASVSQWLDRIDDQPPKRIFAIESALGMPAGSLSLPLGFAPADALPVLTVPEAIAADRSLTPKLRKALLATYEALRAP